MLTIALLGHAAHNDNLGVGALTVSDVRILREIGERTGIGLRFIAIGSDSGRPACIEGPDVEERQVRPLRRPWQLVSALRACDLAVDISGGDSFADIYGTRRLGIIFMQKYLCHLMGKPVVMAPQTIGPFAPGYWRRLAAGTMRRSAVLATRDARSTAFAREIGVTREIVEASDVALRLPYDRPEPRGAGPVRVGINVSGLLMQGGYTGGNEFGLKADYPDLIRAIIRDFLARDPECEVHLVGHVLAWGGTGNEDDRGAALALAQEFPQVIVAPAFVTPSEAKSYIAGLDFFMGARMHACIAAFSSGVPVIPMAYSRKFEGLFGTLGYHHTVDCTADSAEAMLARIREGFDNRAALAEDARTALARGLEKLGAYEAAVEALLVRMDRAGA